LDQKDKALYEALIHIIRANGPINYLLSKYYAPRSLTEQESTFFGDGFATIHHVEFLTDERFREIYLSAWDNVSLSVYGERDSFSLAWRAHICTWAAQRALHIDGDFVECGVHFGLMSLIVCKWVDFENVNKKFWLFDTWGQMEGSHENQAYQDDIFDIVKSRFTNFKNVNFVRGIVPQTLDALDEVKSIAYVSIDMNGHIAERAALEIIYPKLTRGGIIYFDDYGWSFPKLRETVADFLHDKPEKLLHFPSGNSILIKT
jgi:O-methyltransferase